ncbi:hypothetical protein LCGC14_1169350 [marine sediment metagenome]|uniref:Uncharacterized protein n=1 Tax=marine sediment metagenome TaxID=412755 RepID=A0A0F9LV79_9ZZZZ
MTDKALVLPDESQFRTDMEAINRFQQVVRATMIDGQDYGVIPGTQKPTLLKPGAEKIAKLLGLADTYEIEDKAEDWGRGFFRYIIKCRLVAVSTGAVVSEGYGECNSMESKYRWRWVFPNDVPETVDKKTLAKKEGLRKDGKGSFIQYRIENDDIYSQVNTILKMSKKRALVDAALSAGRLSQVFTQDLEDLQQVTRESKPATSRQPAPETKPDIVHAEKDSKELWPEASPPPTESIGNPTEAGIEPPPPVTPDTLVKLEKTIVDTGYTSKEANGIISEWKWKKISAWSQLTEDQAVHLIGYLEKNPKMGNGNDRAGKRGSHANSSGISSE